MSNSSGIVIFSWQIAERTGSLQAWDWPSMNCTSIRIIVTRWDLLLPCFEEGKRSFMLWKWWMAWLVCNKWIALSHSSRAHRTSLWTTLSRLILVETARSWCTKLPVRNSIWCRSARRVAFHMPITEKFTVRLVTYSASAVGAIDCKHSFSTRIVIWECCFACPLTAANLLTCSGPLSFLTHPTSSTASTPIELPLSRSACISSAVLEAVVECISICLAKGMSLRPATALLVTMITIARVAVRCRKRPLASTVTSSARHALARDILLCIAKMSEYGKIMWPDSEQTLQAILS